MSQKNYQKNCLKVFRKKLIKKIPEKMAENNCQKKIVTKNSQHENYGFLWKFLATKVYSESRIL